MKKLELVVTSLLVAGLVVTGCAAATTTPTPDAPPRQGLVAARPAWEEKWEKVLEKAKLEGALAAYSIIAPEPRDATQKAFQDKFGIKVEFLTGRGEELLRRVQSERQAGLYLPDVMFIGGTTLNVNAKPMGILDDIEPVLILPEVTDPKVWRTGKVPFMDRDKKGIGMIGGFHRYVARNTEMVREDEIKSYRDLLNPKWKGKLAMQDPTVAGTGSAFVGMLAKEVWDRETAQRFLRDLARQEPAITRDKRQLGEWVARGKYPISIAMDFETVAAFLKVGAPLEVVQLEEGGKISIGAGAIVAVKNRPHPEATALFVNWLLTREGQTVFSRAFGYPSNRVDVGREGFDSRLFPRPGERVIEDSEELSLFQEESMKISKEIFAGLIK